MRRVIVFVMRPWIRVFSRFSSRVGAVRRWLGFNILCRVSFAFSPDTVGKSFMTSLWFWTIPGTFIVPFVSMRYSQITFLPLIFQTIIWASLAMWPLPYRHPWVTCMWVTAFGCLAFMEWKAAAAGWSRW